MIRAAPETLLTAYATKGKASALSVPNNRQLSIYQVRAVNNSGGAIATGICRKHLNNKWGLLTATTGGTVYADVTTTIQAGGNVNAFTTTNNDGIIVQSERRSSFIGMTVQTAGGSAGTIVVKYWDGSGFNSTSMSTFEVPAANTTAGQDTFAVFRPHNSWVVGGPAGNTAWYQAFIQATSATTSQACVINALWVGELIEVQASVADKGVVLFPSNGGLDLSRPIATFNGGEGIFPYFGTANAANQFSITYGLSE